MNVVRRLWSHLRSLVLRSRLDRDFDDELATHLALLIDEARRRGLSEPDARREAIIKLGVPASLRDQHRDARSFQLVDALLQDSRYAVRMLWKTKVFTAVVVLTLALGIGANTALFSLIDNLLLRSLPVRDPDRLVQLQIVAAKAGPKKPLFFFDRQAFDVVRGQTQIFADVVGMWRLDRPTITIDGATEPVREVERVSENFFRDLGVAPVHGRAPQAADETVAVISASWWRSRFGGRDDVLGRAVVVDGTSYTIIGVAPQKFHGFDLDRSTDVWIAPAFNNLMMVARLKPGVTLSQAQAAAQPLLLQALQIQNPGVSSGKAVTTQIVPVGQGRSQLRDQYRGALLALMALVTLVLLTTCTNVGNLLVLRNAARRRELSVRAALGAGRSRLILQHLVESSLLAGAGCVAGLLLAQWGVSMILSMLPVPVIPDGLMFQADVRVVGFAAGVAVLSALLFGLAPAWRATDVDLTGALRSSQGVTQPKRTRRLARVLVACQVGLAVLLLVGAGLFVRTLRNLGRLDVGYSTDHLLQVSIDPAFAGYTQGQVGTLVRLLLERVTAVPGVRSAAGVRNGLMSAGQSRMATDIPGLHREPDDLWDSTQVGPSFFETMGIAAVRGRTFADVDVASQGSRFVVNEAFARQFFGDKDPTVTAPTIIGVVPDVKLFGLRKDVAPLMYELMRGEPDRVNALEVRTVVNPDGLTSPIRRAIQDVNPRLFVGISTLDDVMNRGIAKERMVAAISAFFSLLGLTLASIGIFGVAASTVAQRTKELGIRRALGAGQWSVVRESLRETLLVFAIGLLVGTLAAIGAVRVSASFVSDLLYGLSATDAANLAGAAVAMMMVALVACLIPALRATRINPLTVIRDE